MAELPNGMLPEKGLSIHRLPSTTIGYPRLPPTTLGYHRLPSTTTDKHAYRLPVSPAWKFDGGRKVTEVVGAFLIGPFGLVLGAWHEGRERLRFLLADVSLPSRPSYPWKEVMSSPGFLHFMFIPACGTKAHGQAEGSWASYGQESERGNDQIGDLPTRR